MAIALAALLMGACGDGGDDIPLPEDPDIRGAITLISPGSGDVIGSVRIEGEVHDDTAYDKAVVRVEDDTQIYRAEGEALIGAGFGDLAVGQTVEAWFTGPVAESYPVQAKAAQIVILAGAAG